MQLKKEIKVSTIVHISILICIIVWPIIFPHKYKYNRQTIHTVQLIQLPAIRPQQTITVPKPKVSEPVKEPPTKPVPQQKTPALVSKPVPKPLTTPTLEEKLLKRLEKIEWKEPSRATHSAVSATKPVAGFTTSISTPSNFPFQWYLDLIHDKISSCWYEPQMVLDKQYTAIITFTIMQDGRVHNIHIKKSSGISNFDQSGIRAIELARPFPQLPQGFSHSQLTVNVAFNLE